MAWAKLDDRYASNRKIRRAWRRNDAAIGVHVFAITHSSMHETDGLVDLDCIEDWIPKAAEREKVLEVLTACKLFDHLPAGETTTVTDTDGAEIVLGPVDVDAWVVHDYLEYNPSSVQGERSREWDRRRKELQRDPELIAAIRARDKDRCRYCGQQVNWKDRRGPAGATYDHVIPRGPNSLDNVVVACRRCNLSKGARTPEQARMVMLPPGALDDSTLGPQVVPRFELGRGPGPAQVGPTHPSRPVPSPPVPIPDSPPSPPRGNRQRDQDRYDEVFTAWGLHRFPRCEDQRAVTTYAKAALARGATTWDELAAEVERQHGPARAAA